MSRNNNSENGIHVLMRPTVEFHRPHPEVGIGQVSISCAGWVETPGGVVVFDALESEAQARQMLEKIRAVGKKITHVIYSHGHGDHTGGIGALVEDGPEVIAQKLILERMEKYSLLKQHQVRRTMIQFNFPRFEPKDRDLRLTQTYDERFVFYQGGRTFELHHARAETDDATWMWVPELKTVFVGDLLLGVFPNIGNPYKPTRFALPWARALEEIRALEPELIVCGGLEAYYAGAQALEALDVTIEAIHSVHDQVVAGINDGVPLDELIHQVKVPAHLEGHPCLAYRYSRPEFAVINIYRWYHGYFDFNPAHLLPRPKKELNAEILDLIGSDEKIMARASDLYEAGQAQLGLEVLDLLLTRDPEDRKARKLRLGMLNKLASDDFCLMSKNTLVGFIERDKRFLGEG